MEVDYLFSFIKSHYDLPQEKNFDDYKKYWSVKKYAKGDFFNNYGNTCKHLAFVISGIFRTYYLDEKTLKEHNIFFHLPNDFVTAFRSFIAQKPCQYNVQALTDSTTVYIHKDYMNLLYKSSKNWETIGRRLAENSFNSLLQKMELLRMNAKDRYINFLLNNPSLDEIIPQYHIASYLGIETPSLSRIKKSIINQG